MVHDNLWYSNRRLLDPNSVDLSTGPHTNYQNTSFTENFSSLQAAASGNEARRVSRIRVFYPVESFYSP